MRIERPNKASKAFGKAFACAGGLFLGITALLVANNGSADPGGPSLTFRLGYVFTGCFTSGFITGLWAFFSKKWWSWGRYAITVIALYVLTTVLGRARRSSR